MMAGFIYSLCALAAFGCAVLLLVNSYRNKSRLLLWSGLCFFGLGINNFLLILDRIIFTDTVDLSTVRLIPALIGVSLLIFGLIWESE